MVMSCSQKQEQKQALEGGHTESVFPLVAEWLETSERQRALRHVGNGRLPGRFHSKIDAVFCLAFKEWEKPCQAFYKGSAPRLLHLLTPAELEIYQYALLRVLEVAYESMCAKRQESWGWTLQRASDPLVEQLRALGPPPTFTP
jgi:hypothetical protein